MRDISLVYGYVFSHEAHASFVVISGKCYWREHCGTDAREVGLISQPKGTELAYRLSVRVERSTWRRVCCARRGLHGVNPRQDARTNPMIRPDCENR